MVNKKAISPVVATVLLLVVAVVAVVGFQTWFQTYQSGVTADVEKQSQTGTAISVERLETGALYIKNSGVDPVNITSISIDGNAVSSCNSSGIGATAPGVVELSQSPYSCNITALGLKQGSTVDVVIVTKDGIFQESEIVR